jgi:hypothetical protein
MQRAAQHHTLTVKLDLPHATVRTYVMRIEADG